jgi:hypothetical protein
MTKLPTIDPAVKVVNEILQPYFNQIANEVRPMSEMQRHKTLSKYRVYLEGEARATKRLAVRIQIRINLAALLERFDYNGPRPELNVRPKTFNTRVFEGAICRNADEDEQGLLLNLCQ